MRSFTLLLCACVAACGPDGGNGDPACEGAFLPGDLVITEIMANPDGPDSGNEWFEIYNNTGMQIDLAGLTLLASREDLSRENSHVMRQTILGPGEYFVLGGVLPEFAPAHVDYGYGSDLGDLINTAGRVALTCDVVTVDEVIYADMRDGLAQGFDGARAPDHTTNDDRANWCEATIEYAPGNFGSPGAANEPCSNVVPDTCDDNGINRPVVSPQVGDLVISEMMPDPSAVGDAEGEWFEIHVINPVDLNGLTVAGASGSPTSVNDSACLAAAAGDYLVFARNTDMAVNGGLEADFGFSFTLANSSGMITASIGETVLDVATYSGSRAGVSISLSPDALDPDANDDELNWCDATTTYGLGDKGTPGAANDACPVVVPPGMCDDGGTLRAIVPPAAGELMITEYMADPDVISDANGEWFEIKALANFDLNELRIGRTQDGTTFGSGSQTIDSVACLPVTSGSYYVLAKNADPLVNGGIDDVIHTFSFSLVNNPTLDGIMVAIDGGAVLDVVTYSGARTAGVADAYDETLMQWCKANTPYGTGDNQGTPGMVNAVDAATCVP
jgi:hypothetical protein